jgi:uncharacterized membrane protein YfcA
VTPADAAIGVAIGFGSGILAGLFGVGGGIVMTPGVQVLLGAPPIVALATPLPVIFPTALAGASAYARRGEVDARVAAWLAGPGLLGAVLGAWATRWVETSLLLLLTAGLLAWQAVRLIVRDGEREHRASLRPSAVTLGLGGVAAGFVSGLLGIGGGLVIVPFLAGWLGMPLKRVLGTSLLAIVALVVPGTVVHAALGHVDLGIVVALAIGAIPGARIGAGIALGTGDRTLRLAVGTFLFVVAVGYAALQAAALLGS